MSVVERSTHSTMSDRSRLTAHRSKQPLGFVSLLAAEQVAAQQDQQRVPVEVAAVF
jgi:hypothetical protein